MPYSLTRMLFEIVFLVRAPCTVIKTARGHSRKGRLDAEISFDATICDFRLLLRKVIHHKVYFLQNSVNCDVISNLFNVFHRL